MSSALSKPVQPSFAGNAPAVQRRGACSCGGSCPRCQRAGPSNLRVGEPGDRHEQDADRVASVVMRATNSRTRPLTHDGTDASGTAAPLIVNDAMNSPSEALDSSTRRMFEPRFGEDFSRVRIHTDSVAAESARAIHSRAYTLGDHVVFNTGRYQPQTIKGQRLIAHELAHVVQHRGTNASLIRRDDETADSQRPPVSGVGTGPLPIPGTGTSVTLAPLVPVSLLGTTLPLPTSLVLANPTGTGPGFIARISPQGFVGALLGVIDLTSSPREGVPLERLSEPDAYKRISLVNPIVSINPRTGAVSGFAKLSVGSDYPSWLKEPTELDVEVTSTQLDHWTGDISLYGVLRADFELTLKYNTHQIESSLSPVFAPPGGLAGARERFRAILIESVPGIDLTSPIRSLETLLQAAAAGTLDGAAFSAAVIKELGQSIPAGANLANLKKALAQLGDELAHPGYDADAKVRIGRLPISTVSARSSGGKTPIKSFSAAGVIVVPPGTVARVPAPAAGATYQRITPEGTLSATVAALPSLSIEAINQHRPLVEQIPIYTYGEVTYTRNVGKDAKVGVRLTVNVSTPEIPTLAKLLRTGVAAPSPQQEQPGAPAPPASPPPNVMLSIFGSF